MKTIVGLYEQAVDADSAIDAFERAGFSPASLHELRSTGAVWRYLGCTPGKLIAKDTAIGAAIGIAIYAFFGVLVAVGEITIGLERGIALGMLGVFGLLGIFVGGLLGAMYGFGDMEQEGRSYILGVRRGGVLLAVRTADEHADRAMDVMRTTGAKSVKICWRTSDRVATPGLPPPVDRLSSWTRWVARGLGLALILLVLALFVGEGLLGDGLPDPATLGLTESFLLLTLVMTLGGILAAWRWEGVGGLLIVGSVLLFQTINALASGYWRIGVLDPFFLLVGLLLLWDWWRTQSRYQDRPAPNASDRWSGAEQRRLA